MLLTIFVFPLAKPAQSQSADADCDADNGTEDDPEEQQRRQEALMPRTDIADQFTDTLMEQLNDKNWKERQAGLEKIEQLLRDNKFIEANLAEFPTNLGKRLTDTNKILATTALKICEKLAVALGSQGRRFVSVLAPGMIQVLSDNKPALRNTALAALTAWFDNCGGLAPFLEGDMLLEALSAATNPNIKAEMCAWLCQVLAKCKKGKVPAELKAIVPTVYAYVEDRNPEVRTKSQELVLPLMMHIGPFEMLRAMQKIKPTSLTVVQSIVEKARSEFRLVAVVARSSETVVKLAAKIEVKAKKKPDSIYIFDIVSDRNKDTAEDVEEVEEIITLDEARKSFQNLFKFFEAKQAFENVSFFNHFNSIEKQLEVLKNIQASLDTYFSFN